MSFIYGREKAHFDKEWKKLKEQYTVAGMAENAIQELYEFDLSWFRMRRIYENHIVMLPDVEIDDYNSATRSNLYKRYAQLTSDFDDYAFYSRYDWVETISDVKIVKNIKKLSNEDLELLTLIVIEGYSQREIANKLNCSQNAVSKRLIRIRRILSRA